MTSDEEADYYLFDEGDQPVRVVFHDKWTKVVFRTHRADAMFGAILDGLAAIAEYGEDMVTKVAEFERMGVENHGLEPGDTYLEKTSRDLAISQSWVGV